MRVEIIKKLQEDKSLSRKGSSFNSFLKLTFEPTAIEKIKNSITEVSKSKGYDPPSDSLDFPRERGGGAISIESRNLSNSKIPKDRLVEYWTQHKERCPYFNKAVEGWLFTTWYFMATEPEPRIDVNAYEDIERLVYLMGLDGIVSNEKGFIKAACETLFPNKDFFTVEQFVTFLQSTVPAFKRSQDNLQ